MQISKDDLINSIGENLNQIRETASRVYKYMIKAKVNGTIWNFNFEITSNFISNRIISKTPAGEELDITFLIDIKDNEFDALYIDDNTNLADLENFIFSLMIRLDDNEAFHGKLNFDELIDKCENVGLHGDSLRELMSMHELNKTDDEIIRKVQFMLGSDSVELLTQATEFSDLQKAWFYAFVELKKHLQQNRIMTSQDAAQSFADGKFNESLGKTLEGLEGTDKFE